MKKTRKLRNRLSFRGETLENRRMLHGGADASIDFEDLSLASFAVGDVVVADDVGTHASIRMEAFYWDPVTPFAGGQFVVDNRGLAGHAGQDVNLNNINASFDFGHAVDGLSVDFGEYGGNLNLQLNGELFVVDDFAELDGFATSDGVQISLLGGGFGSDTGRLVLSGVVEAFAIGGQELWIDHIHPGERVDIEHPADDECIDFEDLPFADKYGVGDVFVADATGFQAEITGRDFTFSGGGTTSAGQAIVEAGGLAGDVGQELAVNNILLEFSLNDSLDGLTFDFGEYGGNVNLMVNGDFVNFENFIDIDGISLGGVDVIVLSGGHGTDSGTVKLSGALEIFAVGGQELWIDHICPCKPEVQPDCIDFEDLVAGKEYFVGSSFLADNSGLQADIDVDPFFFSDGRPFEGGFARVDTSTLAGHVGQDILVNNVNLDFDFLTKIDALTLRFGEYGGNLNLSINGVLKNFENFRDVDGGVIGGVTVSVPVGGFGSDIGRLELSGGPIHSFAVGGQELWIDHVCVREAQDEFRQDWGDAPDQPYPTLAVNNGARHRIIEGYHLGDQIDAEGDGMPSIGARGDDINGVDDEDGVRFLTEIVPGGDAAEIIVYATGDGRLDAWADFNQDGVWQPDEQIFKGEAISSGANDLKFEVPEEATPRPEDPTYLRFRFSREGGLTPFGPAESGEVEDYARLRGDINQDGTIDDKDLDRLWEGIANGTKDATLDLNGDRVVDRADHEHLVEEILGTYYGDANLDGVVDVGDLNIVGVNWNGGAGGWSRGDFNCDGDVDAKDLNLLAVNWQKGVGSAMLGAAIAPLENLVVEAPVSEDSSRVLPLNDTPAESVSQLRQRYASKSLSRRGSNLAASTLATVGERPADGIVAVRVFTDSVFTEWGLR